MRISPEAPAFTASPTRSASPASGRAAGQKIAGVCETFGDYTPIPAWAWRVSFLALIPCGGIGLVAYLVFWMSLPAPVEQV